MPSLLQERRENERANLDDFDSQSIKSISNQIKSLIDVLGPRDLERRRTSTGTGNEFAIVPEVVDDAVRPIADLGPPLGVDRIVLIVRR